MGDEAEAEQREMTPVTRRDSWWATEGPIEIIIRHLLGSDRVVVRTPMPPATTSADVERVWGRADLLAQMAKDDKIR